MLNVYPDNYSTNLIVPLGPERHAHRVRVVFRGIPSGPGPRDDRQTIAFCDEIQREDIAICEAVQKGLASRTYDVGRYSVRRENGVHHFHRLYADAVAGRP